MSEHVIPIEVTEVVQTWDTVEQTRTTVQDVRKLPKVYTLLGETQAQKLSSLRQWVANNRVIHQLELLAYMDDLLQAPLTLETVDADSLTTA